MEGKEGEGWGVEVGGFGEDVLGGDGDVWKVGEDVVDKRLILSEYVTDEVFGYEADGAAVAGAFGDGCGTGVKGCDIVV